MVEETDRKLNVVAEDVARAVSRREVVFKGLRGLAAAAAAVSVGSLAGVKDAFARTACTCSCAYPGCGNCSCRGKTCPTNGCPSSCKICHLGDCSNGGCPYSDGNWVCCSGCGVCGFGYYVCYDCRCPTCTGCSGCSNKCGCKSGCLCSGCCSPAEVAAEMQKLAAH